MSTRTLKPSQIRVDQGPQPRVANTVGAGRYVSNAVRDRAILEQALRVWGNWIVGDSWDTAELNAQADANRFHGVPTATPTRTETTKARRTRRNTLAFGLTKE